jgi:hypothetical protein
MLRSVDALRKNGVSSASLGAIRALVGERQEFDSDGSTAGDDLKQHDRNRRHEQEMDEAGTDV